MMSKKVTLGQKNSQSTIVGFLAKTTNKNNIPHTSTSKSVLEEKADVNADNKLSNNLCFNKQRRMAGDSVTIDTIINLDNSDSSDSCKSPLKTQLNTICYTTEYQHKSSTEKKERTAKESRFSNILQKNSDYVKTSVISESSDSEEDKKNIIRCLHLNQYSSKSVIGKDEKKEAIVSQNNHYTKCNSDFSSNSASLLEENKEKLNNDNDIMLKNIEDKHLWTPKKHIISNRQDKNTVISDSDIDSPSSKCNGKRKDWTGPDIRLNLKDLGLNKQLGSWIEFIQKKPVMSTIPATKDKLLERREDLKELQIEILDKFCIALELIPLPVLEQFPKFDSDSFKKLQGLHRHIKAKLRLVQTKLSKLQKEDEKNVSESPETSGSPLSKSIEIPISCVSESRSINDSNNSDNSSFDISISKTIDFCQDSVNMMESYTNAEEHDNNAEPVPAVKSPETTIPNKKSTFQLKRPVKTVLGTEVSKTIAEMWEKDQQISKTVNSSIDSDYILVKNTFNDSIKTPPSNEKNVFMQKNIILHSPDYRINTKSQGTFTAKVANLTLTQELEQFPALEESCNTDINDDFIDWPQNNMIQSRKHSDDKAKSKFEKNVEYGKFTGNYKNDGVSGEFDGLTYSHSQEMLKIFPNWRIIDLNVVDTLQRCLSEDIGSTMSSVYGSVYTTKDKHTLFDEEFIECTPYYDKAQVILRMLQHAVTDEVFQNSILTYLNTYQFKTVTSDDLWSAIGDMQNISSNSIVFDVREVMDTWMNQRHYPLIIVIRNYESGETTILQNDFRQPILPLSALHKMWWVPITFATKTDPTFNNTVTYDWLSPSKSQIHLHVNPNDWIIVNVQQVGYYRVAYDNLNWRKIILYLKSEEYIRIDVLNRAQIIDDAFALITRGIWNIIGLSLPVQFLKLLSFDVFTFFELMSYLSQETEYIAWFAVFRNLAKMSKYFPLPESEFFRSRMAGVFDTPFINVWHEEDCNEDIFTTLKRLKISKWACLVGNVQCKRKATAKLNYYLADIENHKLLYWWQNWTYCSGLMAANRTTWDKIMDLYMQKRDKNLLEFLACSENSYIIINYLNIISSNNSTMQEEDRIFAFKHIIIKHARNDLVLYHILEIFESVKPM